MSQCTLRKSRYKTNCFSYIRETDELSNGFDPNDISADIESGVQETDEFDQLLDAFDPKGIPSHCQSLRTLETLVSEARSCRYSILYKNVKCNTSAVLTCKPKYGTEAMD